MTSLEHLQMAERDFMKVAEKAGLPEPDEINYHEEDGEIEVIWHEPKLAVIVECGSDCPVRHDDPSDTDPELDVPF